MRYDDRILGDGDHLILDCNLAETLRARGDPARAFTKSMNGVGLIDARIAAPATSTASA